MYAKIETERLNFLRFNQAKLRSEEYIHLRDAVVNDGNVNDVGRLTILPSSYVGSPRHMHEYTQDAMSYVRKHGRPDLFITFTCNPQWADIKNNLFDGQTPTDRHDITSRVFRQKLKAMIELIVKLKIFGDVRCWMYSIEWQKRGLPHAHILIWLVRKISPDQMDSIISAEIPSEVDDSRLYAVVTKNMIHGPCGEFNPNSPCMIDGKCSKRFPRELISETITGNDGYPLYRRRSPNDNGHTATLKIRNRDVTVDNRWVVPYSPLLSNIFEAHINVEYCNSVKSIKYICKYVNKGGDMAVFGVANDIRNDEIAQYQMGRYISTNEAFWRIFSFPMHERYPAVVHLAVHLENGQRVYFTDANVVQRAAQPLSTTLTAFFQLCESDDFAKTLLYSDVTHYYTWISKKWQRRKQGTPVDGHPGVFHADTMGRLYTVHPNNAECYYLRLLLINVVGPCSFQHLRTVNGDLCQTYREACERLNLLENDAHWDLTLQDASIASSPHQIRMLFAIIISTCFPSNPLELWNKYKDFMAEDYLIRLRHRTANRELLISLEMYNEALIAIEDLCLAIANKALQQLGLPSPDGRMHNLFDRELQREQQYDPNELQSYVNSNLPKLNDEQKNVYDTIMQAVQNEAGGLYFLDAPGGTGKTFVISLILAAIRAQHKIALALASSGIAATLLDGGRTAHSALKLPLNVQVIENPTCNISRNSAMAKVLQQTSIILLDECTMTHKKSLEAINRTMQDLRGNGRIFGGALILLSGDFRQILPVVPRSTPADEINACLKFSFLWRHVQQLTLKKNMRVHLHNDQSADRFSKQLLEIGNGKVRIDNSNGLFTLPNDFCTILQSKEDLIARVFTNIVQNYKNHDWLKERAILAPKNVHVNAINFQIQEKLPGAVVSYKSVDSAMNQDEAVNYPIEFFNSLEPSGMPPHLLNLKVGSAIILLRNLNAPKMCNGTRLAVSKLMTNLIEATILTGKAKGEKVLIPRIPLIPTDLPFEFKRLQFPVRLSFAMSINKAQGQTLQ
ncbi:uncharacterized protein LOC129571291, partial [Sitodiplosis mosellana]|uniref:uncharacterized protein LOC129571291 n=1 Tax=Sitodiplosis mosellana TaxID=263140 RepID=UPI002443C858